MLYALSLKADPDAKRRLDNQAELSDEFGRFMVENGVEMEQVRTRYADRSPSLEDETREDDASMNFGAVFVVLRSGGKLILRSTLLCFVLATVVAFLLPFRYTSYASFIPPTLNSGSSMAGLVAGQLSSMGAADLLGGVKNSGDLYSAILSSRSIARELVKRCDLMRVYGVKKESEAEKTLTSNTSIVVDSKSGIVTLGVTDRSPERARDLASAYLDALRATNGRLALSQSAQRAQFFGDQLLAEKNHLEDAEVELKKTEEESGLIAPTGQTEAEIRTIADTQAQIALRQVQLAALSQSATEQNPEVVRLHSEISDLQGQLARLQKGSDHASTATIPTAKVPQAQLEYVRKEREVKYHEALFEMLSRQYEAARLDQARDAPVLQVLDAPTVPDSKSAPKRLYYMIGGILLGFLGGCIWVLARDPVREMRASLAAGGKA